MTLTIELPRNSMLRLKLRPAPMGFRKLGLSGRFWNSFLNRPWACGGGKSDFRRVPAATTAVGENSRDMG